MVTFKNITNFNFVLLIVMSYYNLNHPHNQLILNGGCNKENCNYCRHHFAMKLPQTHFGDKLVEGVFKRKKVKDIVREKRNIERMTQENKDIQWITIEKEELCQIIKRRFKHIKHDVYKVVNHRDIHTYGREYYCFLYGECDGRWLHHKEITKETRSEITIYWNFINRKK